MQKKVDDAKKLLAEKTGKVEKLVIEKVEEEKKERAEAAGSPAKEETPEEKKEEETKVEKVIEAVVQKELGLDRFCGGCKYGAMPFSCQKRVDWMMDVEYRRILQKNLCSTNATGDCDIKDVCSCCTRAY